MELTFLLQLLAIVTLGSLLNTISRLKSRNADVYLNPVTRLRVFLPSRVKLVCF